MPDTALPRLFGPYVLTRALSSDPLGQTYRAGTASGKGMRPTLLIRVFDGEAIDRSALLPAMENAVEFIEEVKGPAVAKGMVLGVVDDIPFAGMEYLPGRTLDKLLKGAGQGPVPLPVEHALLITEKILIALEAAKPLTKGTGAPHGFLVPAFVMVSNDGDTRVFGGGLGPGLVSSLKDPRARTAFGAYLAPEVLAGGPASMAADIYSTTAILLEALTGNAPSDGPDALAGAVLSLNGNAVPEDVKKLLVRGLSRDPGARFADVTAFKKEIGKLMYGGPYAPSTFNLAFFMHHQFEKAIERERKELLSEELLDTKALFAAEEAAQQSAVASPRPVVPPREITVPSFGLTEETSAGQTLGGTPISGKSGLAGIPVPAVAAAVLILGGAGAWFAMRGPSKPAVPLAAPTPVVMPSAVPTATPVPTPAMVGKEDPAFQAALQLKLQEEEKKIQERIGKEQDAAARKRQVELDKMAEASKKAKEAEDASQAARNRADQDEAVRLAKEASEARQREEAARQAAAAALPKTKEGDLVDVSQVDTPPAAKKVVKPEPTSLALQKHISGTVMMRVLVDENGHAEKIETLRDTSPRVGLGDACRSALSKWEWAPAVKDGKRVKTWIAVPIPFKGL
ncbi:MAG: energy transducer TonB [Thermoanaerobaculia bacterium]